ncbi:MAG TPA: STAS-like domain-containing protein [Bacteriovoracaceae bacterium]|nr:STAS-like domain-containing protein [Bacteriovoracaceae bacterium]
MSHILIQLEKFEEDSYVSRSQAKRLLAGLGKFRTIILDFKNIRNVGQGFVDEVFGVFGLEHPEIHFIINNANDDILFMIRRGLKEREIPQSRISH